MKKKKITVFQKGVTTPNDSINIIEFNNNRIIIIVSPKRLSKRKNITIIVS